MTTKLTDELKESLEKDGYFMLVDHPVRGICGLQQFAFTFGIVVNVTRYFYDRRYCYPDLQTATEGYAQFLVGKDHDPQDPDWIKCKGSAEYLNLNNPKFQNEIT